MRSVTLTALKRPVGDAIRVSGPRARFTLTDAASNDGRGVWAVATRTISATANDSRIRSPRRFDTDCGEELRDQRGTPGTGSTDRLSTARYEIALATKIAVQASSPSVTTQVCPMALV